MLHLVFPCTLCYNRRMSEFRMLRSDFLNLDLSEFGKFERLFRDFPVLARKGMAQFLNDMGFAWRPMVVSHLASHGMIMRSPKFIESRMRVEKTSAKPIALQRITLGSTYVRGKGGRITFDGFASLQGKHEPDRNRTLGLVARGGSRTAKAKASGKLMPGHKFATPVDYALPDKNRALAWMIREMGAKQGQTFIVPKGYAVAPGLYRIKNKTGYTYAKTQRRAPQIQIVQHFGASLRTHRWDWIGTSIKRLIAHYPYQKAWATAIAKATAPAMRVQTRV